jgi:hypothetical protein
MRDQIAVPDKSAKTRVSAIGIVLILSRHFAKALKRPVNQWTLAGMTCLRRPWWGGPGETLLCLLRKNPLHKVFDLFCILGIDNLVIFFGAVRQLNLCAGSYVLGHLFFSVGLSLVLCRNLLIGRAFLVLVGGMAFGAIIFFRQRLYSVLIEGKGSAGRGEGGNSKGKAEKDAISKMELQFKSPF